MARGPRRPNPASNRTDLATPTPAPIQTAPGQPYGEAAAQQDAQRAVPTANGPTMAPGGPAAPPPQGQPGVADVMAGALAHNGPGSSMLLNRPTERPNEPVTHGLPMGPGAGPEALAGVGAVARNGALGQATLTQYLSQLAGQPNAPTAVQDLAARVQSGVQ